MTPFDHADLLEALASGDDDRAEAAAVAFSRLGDAALPLMRELLARPDADARWWATRTIGGIESAAAVQLLIGQCADPDPDVRACAVYALGSLGERAAQAAPTLARRLGDSSVYIGQLAADALARIGPAATPLLIDRLTNGTPHVRGRAARALAQLADPAAIPALVAALDGDSPIVEYYADIALQKLGVGMVLLKV
jgi:HEAT repeat protein